MATSYMIHSTRPNFDDQRDDKKDEGLLD